ncbi:DUF3306 domain-containing protein [Vibrio alfacsensis]|uniref:DUF3306 domain-containing protein n=1 Tax=Vibrio alfacsensis TaxID=1074311 RepID=UPI004069247D
MATSFFSRWSKRKLEETTIEPTDAKVVDSVESTEPETAQAHEELSTETESLTTEATATETESQQTSSETTDPEEMSVAQLLVSEASESVKKAALRKMFLSEEFNVRDGLDDYDDDYSTLKSLSEGVAETLRDWIKEKPEEEQSVEEPQYAEMKEESETDVLEAEAEHSAEITKDDKDLYINTVPVKEDTLNPDLSEDEVRQNIPYK